MTSWRGCGLWRTLALGITSGATGLFVGCQSALPTPDKPHYAYTTHDQSLHQTVPIEAKTSHSSPTAKLSSELDTSVGRVRTADVFNQPSSGPASDYRVERSAFDAPSASEETIDLGVALRLAGVNNPTINLARERVQEALADRLAAVSLLLPSINVGGNYRYHSGPLQDEPGEFRNVNLQSLYLGFGTGAIGANPTAVPGVRLFAHLGDAVYEPLAASQRVTARRSDAQATQNQVLLDVVVAYMDLVGAETRLDILRRAEMEVAEIERVTAEFARVGQGAPPDANRAAANAELVRRQLRQAEGELASASARLCRLLNLDPSIRLRTPGGPVELIRLLPEDTEVESLLATATQSRPELLARAAAIREARTRVQQAQIRPLLPTVSAGYSAGIFGGGGSLANSTFSSLNGRSDFDVVAVWSLRNLGLGNRAWVRSADAVVGQAVAGYDAALNQMRREVVAALADAQAAARQVGVARTALANAEEGYRLENERVRRGEGLPIEVLDSFRQLLETRQELLRTALAFNVAQFRLFVAIGSNPAAGSACTPRDFLRVP